MTGTNRAAAAAVLAATVLGSVGRTAAGDPAEASGAGGAAELRRLLAEHDKEGGGVITPIEQAIMELRDRGDVDGLASFLGHPHFGATMLWALVSTGKPGIEAMAIEGFAGMTADKAEAALALAGLKTEKARKAIRSAMPAAGKGPKADKVDSFSGRPASAAWRAALVRAGDEAARKALRADLKSDDAGRVAAALMAAADARATEFLADAGRLAADPRPLPAPIRSEYSGPFTVEKGPDGIERHTSTTPERKTVGEAALEAANRMVQATTPRFIAGWYELEKEPRFGFDEKAAERVRAWAAADERAAKAKAPRADAAVAALAAHLRRAGRRESELHLASASFDGKWMFRYELDGAAATATVEAGKVTTEIPAPAAAPQ